MTAPDALSGWATAPSAARAAGDGEAFRWFASPAEAFAFLALHAPAPASVDPVAALARIADRCLRGEPLPADEAVWIGERVGEWFAARGAVSLDRALGLVAAGHAAWWRRAALAERDATLREIAARHFPNLTPSAAAREIARIACRIEGGRTSEHPARSAIAALLQDGQKVPHRAQLIAILAGNRPISNPVEIRQPNGADCRD